MTRADALIAPRDERRIAVEALLQLPDPDDLEPRVHVLTCEGKPDRHQQIPQLAAAWVAIHQLGSERTETRLLRALHGERLRGGLDLPRPAEGR